MKTINLTSKDIAINAKVSLVDIVFIVAITILSIACVKQSQKPYTKVQTPKRDITTIETTTETIVKTIEDPNDHEISIGETNNPEIEEVINDIQSFYGSVNAPYSNKIPWLVLECKDRGLNPYLVSAVQALESEWTRSDYCQNYNNCFGYGITDSGVIQQFIEFENYEEGTSYILDHFEVYYKVDTAEQMAANGYNFYPSWVDKINTILTYLNY